MIIRVAGKKDIPAVLALLEGMVAHHRRLDPYYKPFSSFEGLEEEIGAWLSNKDMLVLVAEEAGVIVGYAQVSVEPAPAYAAVKKIGIIYDVFVPPQHRRKSIARHLVHDAFRWFEKKNVKHIELNVDMRNEEAMAFWAAIGFSPYKIRMRLDR